MKATVFLADSAQVDASGKVHALGMGWSRTDTPTGSIAIVVLLQFAAEIEASEKHEVELTLLNEKLERVAFEGNTPSRFRVTVTPTEGENLRFPEVAPIVIGLAPGYPLEPNKVYTWRVQIDGHSNPEWDCLFATN